MKYVAYYRVSTKKQGQSGLGLGNGVPEQSFEQRAIHEVHLAICRSGR